MPGGDLPPQLRRIREQDREAHIEAAMRSGMDREAAERHADMHMAERNHDAYRGPEEAGDAPPGRVEAAKRHQEAREAEDRRKERPDDVFATSE